MLDEILKILQQYPQAKYECGDNFVRIPPCSTEGFEVAVEQVWENHFMVSLGRWRQDFYTAQEAVECFLFGLTNRCRLKVESKNSVPFRWTVEQWSDPSWSERSTCATWSYRFLTPPTTAYYQNDLLPEDDMKMLTTKLTSRLQPVGEN
jgi:hypothetical protein